MGTLHHLRVNGLGTLLAKIRTSLFGKWFSLRASADDSLAQRLISQTLRAKQLLDEKESCNNATCHRVRFTLGRMWNHRNLDEVTHRHIDQVVADSVTDLSVQLLEFSTRVGQDGELKAPGPLFGNMATREGVAKLKEIPILLLARSDNQLFSPESVEKSYKLLCDTFGPDMYKLKIVPGYGHYDCWVGCNSWRDVYPIVREKVDRVVRGDPNHDQEPNDKWALEGDSHAPGR